MIGFVFLLALSLVMAYNNEDNKSQDHNKNLELEKQELRAQILRDYLDGEINQEEGVRKLRELSCEMAKSSGAKYNLEVCYG